jgi:hypothetical protein
MRDGVFLIEAKFNGEKRSKQRATAFEYARLRRFVLFAGWRTVVALEA